MLDQEWFVGVLTKKELAFLCNKFKVRVQGFQRNLLNAPEHTLITGMNIALTNGIKRKKENAIVFEDMLMEIVEGVKDKCSYINNLTFEEFMIRAETDSSISTYQIIAVTFIDFPDQYRDYKTRMIDNLQKKYYIFHGLSKELSRPIIEKIKALIDSDLSHEENYSLLKRFDVDISLSEKGNIYRKINEKPKTEEQIFKLLTEVHEEDRYLVLVSFLLHNNHYKEQKYNSLLVFCLSEVQKFYSKKYKEQIDKEMERILNYEKENKNLNEEIQRITSEYDKNKNLLIELEEKQFGSLQILETIQIKYENLNKIIRQNEPLQMFFLRLVSENNFLIITKDSKQFVGTPLEGVIITPTDFKKQLRKNLNHTFREQIIFVTRVSFQTGWEWFQFKNSLEENELNYEELGHYDISHYIKEVIGYLCRKEILIYADEI